jgi:hypothetical protein
MTAGIESKNGVSQSRKLQLYIMKGRILITNRDPHGKVPVGIICGYATMQVSHVKLFRLAATAVELY